MNRFFVALEPTKASLLFRYTGLLTFLAIPGLLFRPIPVFAHHPFGGNTPTNAVEGVLSGLGHPVIGLDHLAFVIAAGLLAAVIGRGLLIPISFVVGSLAGPGVHLMALNLPATEWVIAASVFLFGVLLSAKSQPKTPVVIGLAAVAGLFHGYAYGEAIVGAEMGPLVAYLLGFSFIQLAIALGAYWVGRTPLKATAESSGLTLRFAGFVICGVGAAFLSTLIVDAFLAV